MSLKRLTGILDVHPVKPRTAGGSHFAKYLITMCRRIHGMACESGGHLRRRKSKRIDAERSGLAQEISAGPA
jgi:hypothetical protein